MDRSTVRYTLTYSNSTGFEIKLRYMYNNVTAGFQMPASRTELCLHLFAIHKYLGYSSISSLKPVARVLVGPITEDVNGGLSVDAAVLVADPARVALEDGEAPGLGHRLVVRSPALVQRPHGVVRGEVLVGVEEARLRLRRGPQRAMAAATTSATT